MYDYVRYQLERHKGVWSKVAEEAAVSFVALRHIAAGRSKHPSVHTIQALHDYFKRGGLTQPPPAPKAPEPAPFLPGES